MTSREHEEVHHLRLVEEEERISSSSTSSTRGDEEETTCSSSNTTTMEEEYSSSSPPQLLRDPQRKHPPFVFLLTFFAGLGGFLFGYDTGVISGAMLFLSEEFGIENDNFSKELVVSGAIFGAIFGALFASFLNERWGRKPAILCSSALFVGGAFLMAFSFRLWELIIGRFIAGLGIGIASMTVPVYIAEVAPSSIRGALVSADVLLITGGQFVSYGVDLALANHKDNWRWMLGVSAIPGVVQFTGMFFLPESPRWLISERPERKQEAVSVLRRIRGSDDLATEEVKEIELSIQEEKRDGVVGCWDYQWISNPILRRALVVSVGLQIFQQLAGINTVMYYSPTILQMAGFGDKNDALVSSMAVALTNAIFTVVAVVFMDRFGRRPMMLGSLIGVYVSLLTLAIAFAFGDQGGSRWAAFIALIMYIVFFAPGMGPGPWLIQSEIFPTHARGAGNSIASAANWIANLAISLSFLSTIEALSATGAFLLYAGIVLIAFEFVWFVVPETKGLTLEQVQHQQHQQQNQNQESS